MTRAEFQKSEQNMADLIEILRTPVMRLAIEIVKSESVGLPEAIPGVSFQAQVATVGAFTAGVFRAFSRLESLSRPNVVPSSTLPRQTQYDDAARARMRAAGIYTDQEIETL
jgi:hypothetical protein